MNGLRTLLQLRSHRPMWIGDSDVHLGDALVLVFCIAAAVALFVSGVV